MRTKMVCSPFTFTCWWHAFDISSEAGFSDFNTECNWLSWLFAVSVALGNSFLLYFLQYLDFTETFSFLLPLLDTENYKNFAGYRKLFHSKLLPLFSCVVLCLISLCSINTKSWQSLFGEKLWISEYFTANSTQSVTNYPSLPHIWKKGAKCGVNWWRDTWELCWRFPLSPLTDVFI